MTPSVTFWNINIVGIGQKIKWLKVKWMRFQKYTPLIAQFNYNMSDEHFMELDVSPQVKKKEQNNIIIPQGGKQLKLSQK